MPSTRSTHCSTAARRARVSRLPSPASIRSRVLSVSSKVIFPELPDASMDTLKPIAFPQCSAKQIFRIIAERTRGVNEIAQELSRNFICSYELTESVPMERLAGEAGAVQREGVQGGEHSYCDLFWAGEILWSGMHLFARFA